MAGDVAATASHQGAPLPEDTRGLLQASRWVSQLEKLWQASDPRVSFPSPAPCCCRVQATDAVHGVLGQSFRTGPEQFVKSIQWATKSASEGKPIQADSVEGFLEGDKKDYISSSVTKPDCKVTAFKR